ncbi:hypothetical protein HFP51_04675 [Parasphingopyxis sp. CP4]|uniref:hypothetical protein n=1 Tax=Parasphingopyxis sp. CP4 TaxID=2724527 RepID=UPI0015A4B335|nr:hypothetical protein [Parasphingopyxis sp. CP4]QLC21533.1 hypothetical protein HFP51_04675 [Parasphingopyxis sp. CP4]
MESWRRELRFDDRLYQATVIGIARDCGAQDGRWSQAVWAQAVLSGGVVVSGSDGFCGWHGYGTVIVPVEVEYGNHLQYPRRMGPEASARIGSLWEIESGNPLHGPLVEFMTTFLSDLRSGDRGRFVDDEYSENTRLIGMLFDPDPRSPFYFLMRGGNDPQYAFFWSNDSENWLPSSQVNPDEDGGEQVAACFCRDEDCTGRWPIAWFDAAPKLGQPYVCIFGRANLSYQEQAVIERVVPRSELFRGASPFYEPEQHGTD